MQRDQDHAEVILAVDVGGTFIKSGLFSGGELVRELPQIPSRSDGDATEVVAAMRAAIAAGGGVDRIGIAIPGPFDYAGGVSLMTHKFAAIKGMSLRDELEVRCPLCFIHDVDAFLLGEMAYGGLRGVPRAGGVTLGTGLGAAVAIDGRVLDGALGSPAPEVQLWNLPFRDGIAEDFVSSRALLKKYAAPSVKDLAQYAKSGDVRALEVWREFGRDLAELLTGWVERLKLDKVVLGGQISRDFQLFGASLQQLPLELSVLPGAALYGAYHAAKSVAE